MFLVLGLIVSTVVGVVLWKMDLLLAIPVVVVVYLVMLAVVLSVNSRKN